MVDDGLVLDVLLNEFAVVVGLALLSFLSQPSTLNPQPSQRITRRIDDHHDVVCKIMYSMYR